MTEAMSKMSNIFLGNLFFGHRQDEPRRGEKGNCDACTGKDPPFIRNKGCFCAPAPGGEEMEEEGKFTFFPPSVPSQRLEPNRNIVCRNALVGETYSGTKPSAPKS